MYKILLLFGVGLLCISGIVGFFSIDREYIREKRLSPTLEIEELVHVDRRVYTPVAHNGRVYHLPKPFSSSSVVKQSLIKAGRVVWETKGGQGRPLTRVHFRLAPNERFVLLESQLHSEPWLILDLHRGRTCSVSDPGDEIAHHDYLYPFSFLSWAKDSGRLFAYASGGFVTGPGRIIAFREIWVVEPVTGAREKIRRCEKPWAISLNWNDTECK